MINIYKASAGAGKTHKLTGEYIKLLFKDDYAFKHILAVTFTNKATDEMKHRILEELYNLSIKDRKSDYLNEIIKLTSLNEELVRNKAKKILISILHDYSSFSVSTIDKFFQIVMRSFARELGKMATYNVELDRDSVLQSAIDRMFSDLDDSSNEKLLKWLIEYSLDAVDKGDSWNVKNDIVKLGKYIFSEDFKLLKEQTSQSVSIESVATLKRNLKESVEDFEKKVKAFAAQGKSFISGANLSWSDFKGGSRSVFKYFYDLSSWSGNEPVKVPSPSFIDLHNNIDKWYTGKICPADISNVYENLNGVIGNIVKAFEDDYYNYLSAYVVLANVNILGILNDIYNRVLDYCKEKNIILLSESTELLNKIIDGSDTPFIYEKIGTRIDHYMLDEFQDTSSLQWRNFYPLLSSSTSMGNDNLIVGDVKQSIYRWRGSDWRILKSDVYKQFSSKLIKDYSLDMNWRSGANIIDFNNDFFEYCAGVAQNVYADPDCKLIEDIYSNFKQQVPPSKKEKPGYVELNFIKDSKEDFSESVLNLLPDRIKELLKAGYKQKDIAILIRKKSQGNQVAKVLLDNGLSIISSDSLTVSSSMAVQKIINILRAIDNPNNSMLVIYRAFMDIPSVEDIEQLSLYQMCENIIRESLSQKERDDIAFLQAFLDMVLDYTTKEGTNISGFLKWWDEVGVGKTITAPEDLDAIRIMTIHKSKGLGFNVVIIPFLKDNLDHVPNLAPILWCSYNNMAVPVKYMQRLADTCFRESYLNEKLSTYIDNLNTVYVAFTRPKKALIVYGQATKMNKKGEYSSPNSICDILYKYYLEKLKDASEASGDAAQLVRYCVGSYDISSNEEESLSGIEISKPFEMKLMQNRTRTSAVSGSIVQGESIREHGIAMHYVFSLINKVSDVDNAIEQAILEGVTDLSKEQLRTMITQKIDGVKGYGWFDDNAKILNECSIISEDGNEFRPDRIIIKGSDAIIVDYKFGGYPTEDTRQYNKYIKQLEGYKKLLVRMNYSNVKAYLWYIAANEIVEV